MTDRRVLDRTLPVRTHGRFGTNLRRIISNTGWLFIDKAITVVVGTGVVAWMARYLGPQDFGVYSYAVAFALLFTPLATLGLDTVVIRQLVRAPATADRLLGTTFVLRLVSGGVSFAAAVVAISWLRPEDNITRILVAIIAARLVLQAFDTIDLWFQSRVESKYTVAAKKAAYLIVAGVKIGLILLRAPLVAFVWASLAEALVGAVGLVLLYHIVGWDWRTWSPCRSVGVQLLNDSWPLLLSGVAIAVYMKIDRVMLGNMVGDHAVGLYSVATTVSEVWYFIPAAVTASVFPAIINSRDLQSKSVYSERMQLLYDLMALSGYAVAVALSFLAAPLITGLFGMDYAAAGRILQVHIWAFIFVSLGTARDRWLVAENLVRFSMVTTIVGTVVNVGLNLWLIPRYEGLGAAWATLASYAVAAYFACLLSRRLWPVFRQLSLSLLLPFRVHRLVRALSTVASIPSRQ